MDKKETLCWDCQRAVCGCSWAKKLKPVEGWVAEENERGFRVVECPLFIEDFKAVRLPEIAEILNIPREVLSKKIGCGSSKFDRLKLILKHFGYEVKFYKGKSMSIYIRKRRKYHDI